MMWRDLWAAVALWLVFEGIMPFLSPAKMKQTMRSMLSLNDKQLRIMGLLSMLAGITLLYFVN